MNPFELANQHKSIRKYKSTPIDPQLLNQILDCGLRTSSSANMQTWSVIVTKDQEQKKRLYKFHSEQSMILEAPVTLTFCADFYRMRKWLKLRDAKDGFKKEDITNLAQFYTSDY